MLSVTVTCILRLVPPSMGKAPGSAGAMAGHQGPESRRLEGFGRNSDSIR